MLDEIMDKMININYGWVDENGDVHADADDDFASKYRLQSPDELLQSKYGVCWDQVELERKLFAEQNIKHETYFIFIDDEASLPSHTFLVGYMNDKVYWFEHSWYDEKGIHEYSNISELLSDVKQRFVKSRKDEIALGLDVHVYKYDQPQYHISCDDFYTYIYKQEEIEI